MSIASDINLVLNTPLFNPLWWVIWFFGVKFSRFIESRTKNNNEETRHKRLMNDKIEEDRKSGKPILEVPESIKNINEPKKESTIVKWIKKEGWK